MYYPYLRGRQFELIALRELITESEHNDFVKPIIEPVRENVNSLNRANEVFYKYDFHPYLIVNPSCGETAGDTDLILDYLKGLDNCSFIPAFLYFDNNEYIREKVAQYSLDNCMLICTDGFTDSLSLRNLCNENYISKMVILDPKKYRSLDFFIKQSGKSYIRLDDQFQKQVRNSDFLNIQAHKLTEEHLYFKSEGYSGFSDYTVLPSEFIDGGVTPRAVVIHLSYLNDNDNSEIWIRHFTSESDIKSPSNVQGKFEEAAKKALDFCSANDINNTAITELRGYYENQKYPGLGIIKKISIKNHLIIVRDFLLK